MALGPSGAGRLPAPPLRPASWPCCQAGRGPVAVAVNSPSGLHSEGDPPPQDQATLPSTLPAPHAPLRPVGSRRQRGGGGLRRGGYAVAVAGFSEGRQASGFRAEPPPPGRGAGALLGHCCVQVGCAGLAGASHGAWG